MEFSASDIAALLKGEIDGDKNVKVSNVSKIEEGEKGTLAFLANPKYENFIYESKASIILVNKSFVPRKKINATLIKVEDAYKAFARLLEYYVQAKNLIKTGIEQPSYIDQTAIVGENIYLGAFAYIGKNVKIGNNVKIYPQVYIGDNVVIGDESIFYSGCKIYSDTKIGNRCIIHSGAVIGSDGFGFAPQDDGSYKKIEQIGNVILEDDVDIGANTTIDCGTMGSTIIRKGVKLDNLIQIAHNCEIGDNTVMAGLVGLAGSTKVGKNCKFAGQVGLAGHLIIGDNVQIGAQSGVSKSVAGDQIVLGSPAIPVKDALKMYTILRNLPKLRDEVIQLQKEIKELKKGE
ncbi:MAG: UDP-3-O-(3-hydroxymyristoyl)glucosamine N-acyltransferase [Prolixibacteraceae bacterium]|nr:UDP-3-O-(3-hydroxymyristoyl)glucosamine N-acyltransferase [Prolixibacteraceae bacterium]MBN2774765.1 UDP-3-O-(3-hydroxymyristoyl)glucosamine N-acyltransferase [Prolixibacteraceae bacterium]